MSNTDSLASITLRPWPAPAKDALSKEELSTQIHQLTVERGNLRGITEQALQAEIDAGKSLPEDGIEGAESESKKDGIEGAESESKKDGPAPEEKMEELWKKRIEMYEKLE
jgi:mediator of RNA polymerase II transcription subunit 17